MVCPSSRSAARAAFVPAEEDQGEEGEEEHQVKPFSVHVKHTFIHLVADGDRAPKRCGSLPPSLRLCGAGGVGGGVSGGCAAASPRRDMMVIPKGGSGDAYTDAEASTDAGNSVAEEAHGTDAECDAARGAAADAAAAAAAAARPAEAEATPLATPTEWRLRADAAAWQLAGGSLSRGGGGSGCGGSTGSSGSSGPLAPQEQDALLFACQLRGVAESATAAIAGSPWVVGAEALESACGWYVIVRMQPRNLAHKEEVFTLAKEALTIAAENSDSVYIMAFRATPFMPVPTGFVAKFCHVAEQRRACWHVLQQGFCRYGNFCAWEHPACQATISVNFVLIDP